MLSTSTVVIVPWPLVTLAVMLVDHACVGWRYVAMLNVSFAWHLLFIALQAQSCCHRIWNRFYFAFSCCPPLAAEEICYRACFNTWSSAVLLRLSGQAKFDAKYNVYTLYIANAVIAGCAYNTTSADKRSALHMSRPVTGRTCCLPKLLLCRLCK